jgi:tetratricopeptide (TPR) repeat protein
VAPQASLPYVALALVRIQTGRLPEAIEALRLGRAQNPKDYVANWTLGEALSRQGLLPGTEAEKEAVQALEDAVRENPRAAPPRVLLGKLLAKRGELTRAAREFEEALKVDPDDVSASYQLALVYRQTGNAKRADELFAKVGKARSVDPERLPQRDLVKIIREGAR